MAPEKKRKRADHGGQRPAKKMAVAPTTQGTVGVELLEDRGALGPVLASTPGLNLPPHISFAPFHRTAILPTGVESEIILQTSQHPRLDYLAREEKDGSSESLLKDYVGVFDPATNKLQLVEVKRVTVRSTLRSEAEDLQDERDKDGARKNTMSAKRHALAAEFGSKKSRKAIEDITLNAISRGKAGDPPTVKDEAIATNVLQNMTEATQSMPTKKDLAAAVDNSKPRPPANLDAEYAADVYTAENVVGRELLSLIPVKDWVDASKQGQPVNVNSRFVAKRILKIVKSNEIQKLKVLRFIQLCINFSLALRTKGMSGAKQIPPRDKLLPLMGDDVPGPVVDAIRRKFASENNDIPRWYNDNLMTHIAAAALIVDDLEVDVNDLRNDLKTQNKEIRQYFGELGCKVTPPTVPEREKLNITKAEAVNHNIAKLKLPLVFPKTKGLPNKKR
ncbi:DNA-directed RNA polymeras-like protein I 49 kDa polypeptide [Massariosphaeria phaeospora]|uniref:DNA-directed RNA polymeras-like protein I 49 kDa polypeptide n=1 Tax=Massariosphaeria phaeospora TaxID=100035 RepID=A0A7C8M4F6_9PLEO|nr:DNA-directed RNA polymeras-like protein I 49 kDa polypeptide [Massariosphaeria phaeospora]